MKLLRFVSLILVALWLGLVMPACTASAPAPTPTLVSGPKAASPNSGSPTAVSKAAATTPAAALAKPATVTAPPAASAKLDKVKLMVILKGGPFLNFFLSRDKGFFAQEGLDVEIVQMAGPLAIAALASGELDYMTTAIYEFASGVKGLPLKAVLFTIKQPAWYVVGGPGINSVNDLKGKPVGITAIGDMSHYAVKKGLKAKGLDPDRDVTYAAVPARPDKFAALKAKSIAGVLFSTPDQVIAEKENGGKVLVTLGEVVQFPLDGLGTTDKKLRESSDQVKRMITATLRGLAYMRDNREETVQYAAKELNLSQETAQVLYDDLIRSYTFDGLVSDEAIKTLVEASIEGGSIPAELKDKVQVEKGLDTTLLREVLNGPKR